VPRRWLRPRPSPAKGASQGLIAESGDVEQAAAGVYPGPHTSTFAGARKSETSLKGGVGAP